MGPLMPRAMADSASAGRRKEKRGGGVQGGELAEGGAAVGIEVVPWLVRGQGAT